MITIVKAKRDMIVTTMMSDVLFFPLVVLHQLQYIQDGIYIYIYYNNDHNQQ